MRLLTFFLMDFKHHKFIILILIQFTQKLFIFEISKISEVSEIVMLRFNRSKKVDCYQMDIVPMSHRNKIIPPGVFDMKEDDKVTVDCLASKVIVRRDYLEYLSSRN